LIVQQTRLKDGTRKITAITEVAGLEGDTIVLTDVFKFEQTGVTTDGKVQGSLKPTGIRPLFSQRLEAAGIKLGPEIYGVGMSDVLSSGRQRR
jgi:pilus assembly protein CpaF